MRQLLSVACFCGVVLFTLSGTLLWGAAPPNNDVSDANGNTAGGTGALQSNTTGKWNTAFGDGALGSNTDGNGNTAVGNSALSKNTGRANTAVGQGALQNNAAGFGNTALGNRALQSNSTGEKNTAVGQTALVSNISGMGNTAVGDEALRSNTHSNGNTAVGANALSFTNSYGNTAVGAGALTVNTTGETNVAVGNSALGRNTTGDNNIALGHEALSNHTTGNDNIAIGDRAGVNLVSGSSNIYLGNSGALITKVPESNTMRLGGTQKRTFIAGIAGTSIVKGATVVIGSTGQLGILASSARYKRDIHSIGKSSQGLFRLRPVTFRYKQDAQGQRQYGLIAEEVAKVYPELVVRGAKGEVESVQYHELIPMLLNEMQHQQQKLQTQSQELAELKAQNERLQAALVQQNAAFAARLERLETVTVGSATLVQR